MSDINIIKNTPMSVLDACSGSRMFWFDRNNEKTVFGDIRKEDHVLCDGRSLSISPDIIFDFTSLPFRDNQFHLVVFDPPHIEKIGDTSWMALKYGKLQENWKETLHKGFSECMRVLRTNGTLIFKWNETDHTTREVIKVLGREPLFGHKSGKRMKTHWLCFMKEPIKRNSIQGTLW